jgi:hypothetical protein
MTLRRLSVLQWLGILAGGSVWWISYLAGTGVSQAVCNPASGRWGIPHDLVEAIITGIALLLIAGAEVAALVVFRATRHVEEQDPPPHGRLHFFASAALVSNVIFFMIILLAGVATIVDRTCHQS